MASTKLVPVNMLLDMEPSEFESMRDEFLHDLAQILSIEPSEIIITEVRHHCSDVHFLVPEDRAELIRLINSRDLEVPQALLKQVANWRRKYRLMLFLSGPPGFIHKTKYVPDPPKRAITWLHLSDAHFEAPTTGKKLDYWGQDKVRETLIRDLRPLLDEEHLTPDFVFFTGDVAFSGHPSEYDVALSFFAELQESIPNGSDAEFIVVPGNHDVSRSEVSQYHKEELATVKYLKKNSKVIEYVNSPKFEDTRNKVFARLDNYNKFAEDAAAFGQPEVNNGYFFTHTITRHGINIGIAGLNSAWRCSSDKDRGRLVLGVPQIDKAIDQLSQTDMRLLLMHHPPESDWFVPEDRNYQRNKLSEFDFVLRGHEHDPDSQVRGFHSGREYCHVSAGAMYSHDEYHNGFNAVQIDMDTGAAWIFFWRLSERSYTWIKDVELYSNGFHAFDLPRDLVQRIEEPPHLRERVLDQRKA